MYRIIPPRVVLCGPPGSGKTTVARGVAEGLMRLGVRVSGFTTEEVQGSGRAGFAAVTFDGVRVPFAHVHLSRGARVGLYRVDTQAFDAAALSTLTRPVRPGEKSLFVIDEVCPLTCASVAFVERTRILLAGAAPLLLTVSPTGTGLMEELRQLAGASLVELSLDRGAALTAKLVELLAGPS